MLDRCHLCLEMTVKTPSGVRCPGTPVETAGVDVAGTIGGIFASGLKNLNSFWQRKPSDRIHPIGLARTHANELIETR